MPIYEYKCVDCNLHFDKRTQFKNMDSAVSCPNCVGRGNRKLSVFTLMAMTRSQDNNYVKRQSSSGGCCGGECCGGG